MDDTSQPEHHDGEEQGNNPRWLLTDEGVDGLRAFVTLARTNFRMLKPRKTRKFIADLEDIVKKSGQITLSSRQIDYIEALIKQITNEPPKDLRKEAVARSALATLTDEVARIDTELMLLARLKKKKVELMENQLAVEGEWAVEDFAAPLVEAYWNHPDVPSSNLFQVFGNRIRQINQLPERYRHFPTDDSCSRCGDRIYVTSRVGLFKTGRRVLPTCDWCKYLLSRLLETQIDGSVHYYRGPRLIAKYANEREAHASSNDRISEIAEDGKTPQSFSPAPSQADRRQEFRKMSYPEYLQTPEWDDIRRGAYRRAGYRCQVCGNQGKVHVHHNNYPPRGTEQPSDLLVMCERCHQKFHDVMPSPPDG